MKPRNLLFLIATLLVATVAIRLGLWQLSRWNEKRAINRARAAALAAPPLEPGAAATPADLATRRVALHGRFDARVQLLLRGREREGSPGVDVVTPFVLEPAGPAVLVDRGWLAAEDGATLGPGAIPADTSATVVGWVEPSSTKRGPVGLQSLPSDSGALWSAARIDPDSMPAVAWTLSPYVLLALPSQDAPTEPRRASPEPLNEAMHLGYALQWFLIALLVLIGAIQLARARGAPARRPGADPDLPRRS